MFECTGLTYISATRCPTEARQPYDRTVTAPLHPTREQLRLEDVLAALGHPVRMTIVRALASGEEKYCGEIETSAPKSTLTHHWRVLRESGVIHLRHSGRRNYLTLRREDLDARFPGLLDVVFNSEAATGRSRRPALGAPSVARAPRRTARVSPDR
jgi:DNA-binding transcriptional ArsR family regulator